MTNYLIWSNEHQGWWRQNRHGYTTVIQWAGLFGEHEAHAILAGSARGAQTEISHDPLGIYPIGTVPNEVLVPVTAEGHPGGPDCPPRPRQIPLAIPGLDLPPGTHATYDASPLLSDDTDDRYTNP